MLGYHGCPREVADAVITRKSSLIPSDTKYDWVGPGIYFWESDPQRALEWAKERCREGAYESPGVVGAIIDLRNCLDLLNRTDQDLVLNAYDSLSELFAAADKPLPQNRNSKKGGDQDRKARELDCEVIKHLHSIMDYPGEDLDGQDAMATPHFDTVRGMFTEGSEIYPGAAFYHQSHVQIAVRNPECIRGVFLPPELEAELGH
ncbi:MAG: hypothetical protein RL339_1561 [Pseudomonadota bacterium]